MSGPTGAAKDVVAVFSPPRSLGTTTRVALASVTAVCLAITGLGSAAAADPVPSQNREATAVTAAGVAATPISDVAYGPEPRQKLDVYPVAGNQLAPTVVLVYGGGWIGGDKLSVEGIAQSLSAEGFAVFNMNYRLASDTEDGIPEQTDDVALAVQWIMQHGARHGADASHIGLIGGSSGAQQVALAGQLINAAPGGAGTIRTVVELSGVMDFYTMVHPNGPDSTNPFIRDGMPSYLGCSVNSFNTTNPPCTDAQLRGPSPISNIKPTNPAFMLVNSDDEITPVEQVITMDAELRDAGESSTLIVVPGERHGFALYNGQRRQIWEFFRTGGEPGGGGGGGDTTAPTVTKKVPAANARAVAPAKNVTATFSEPVVGVSDTSFVLKNPAGTAVQATVTYNTTTRVATLDPAANLTADTRYTVTLSGGTSGIRDAAGNPLAATGWAFTTGPAPRVKAKTPATGASGVRRTANVTATFSEAVDGVSTATFTLRNAAGSVAAAVSRSGTTNKWILNPTGTLAANTTYTVTVTGGASAIRDLAGNPLRTTTWSFTTGA